MLLRQRLYKLKVDIHCLIKKRVNLIINVETKLESKRYGLEQKKLKLIHEPLIQMRIDGKKVMYW